MRGKKTGGRDFNPGESGNPSGRPRIPREIQIRSWRYCRQAIPIFGVRPQENQVIPRKQGG